ncbi:TlpA family protein disulfide reductase [Pontimicrobium sp. MEBiC06410]
MKNHFYLILLLFITFSSCKEKIPTTNNKTENIDIGAPFVNYNDLVNDYMTWWSYHYNKINLSLDFIAINEDFEVISKNEFLEALTTGNYITIQLKPDTKTVKYKLYKLGEDVNQAIASTIKSVSVTALKHYKMEGTTFPEFNVTDIKGKQHSNKTIKGKTAILKTWFIACKPCVAEFPELNRLVEAYKEKDDIVFTSFAIDTKPKLDVFLKEKPFYYNVVAEQNDFIEKKLNLQIYPTHIVVNNKGIIVKVVNKVSELITFLNNKEEINANNL